MGIFGRSRANTTNEISRPVLTFSDAAPRDDLHSLGKLDSTKSRPHAPTAEKPAGTTSNNGRHGVRRQPQKNVIQAFDFTVAQPPEAPLAVDGPAGLNDGGISSNGIGIALGSPSMVPPPPPPYPPTEWGGRSTSSEKQYTATTMVGGPGSLRRKPSKWKKFGGMLKGRQNDGKRGREGFYQLNLKNDQDDTSPFVQQSRFPVNAGDKQQPIASASPQFSSDRWEDNQQIAPTDSLLAVNIPTVEMERYSVMFRSVLGEKPSSNLLARRSKALNQLHVIGQEPGLHEPPKPQRRATSPSTNGSSTLTLLPRNPQTKTVDNSDDDKTGDSHGFAPRSPIRSNTFPRATKNHHHENNLMVPDLTPALSSATSSGYSYSSAEPSPIPFNMSITTARNCIDGKNEPVWEMITTTKKSASVSPEGIITSSDTETSTKSSLTSSAMTTPLIAQDPVEVVQKGKPTTKPSITVLPPRNASLPAYADRAKLKVKSTIKNNNNNRTQEDDDPLLSLANETNNNPPPPPPRLQLHRSQTMPLPLNITKKTSTTNLLHPSPIHASTDSLDTTTTPSSQTPSPQIPQTIEISIARSVSVSRRIIPRQTLVPLGPANPQIFFSNENERYGELRQKRVPVVIDVGPPPAPTADNRGSKNGAESGSESMGSGGSGPAGHRYQKSQDIVIESA